MLTTQPNQTNIPRGVECVEHQIRHHSTPVARVGVLSYRIETYLAYACDYCSLLLSQHVLHETRSGPPLPSPPPLLFLHACVDGRDLDPLLELDWMDWTGLDEHGRGEEEGVG